MNFLNETSIYHLSGGSESPSLDVVEALAGAGATGFVDGSDEAGIISLTTGSHVLTGGSIFALEFSTPYNASGISPFLLMAPANAAAAALTPAQMIFPDLDASGDSYIQFNTGSDALDSGTEYRWVYHVIGRRA